MGIHYLSPSFPPFLQQQVTQSNSQTTPTFTHSQSLLEDQRVIPLTSFPSMLAVLSSHIGGFNVVEERPEASSHGYKQRAIHTILPQVVSDFATPVIEKNVTESLEAAVLARSSSQPKSTYEAATSFSEFELIKVIIEKMEKNKSYDKSDYKKELYDTLVNSYQTDTYLFDTYSEVFTLKRSRDDIDKDQDPSARSDRGTKRRKSSKEAESSRDSRSKEKKSSSTSKDASHSQHKPSGKSDHAEKPSHTVDDLRVQQHQEFDTGNNDEQPTNKEVSKADWFKKPKRHPTLDPD
nr:hypothetical protein [Tanacetum cinerariifolium]